MACGRCGKIHERNRCPVKRESRRDRSDEAARFRSRKAWRDAREHVRRLDGGMCVMCRAEGVCTMDRLSVHHIVPLAEDATLGLDESNLVTLCPFHHELVEGDASRRDELRALMARFREN